MRAIVLAVQAIEAADEEMATAALFEFVGQNSDLSKKDVEGLVAAEGGTDAGRIDACLAKKAAVKAAKKDAKDDAEKK
jgi:predicted DsbA family dithiol-disulfide isomerase